MIYEFFQNEESVGEVQVIGSDNLDQLKGKVLN